MDGRSARMRLGQLVDKKRLTTSEFVRFFNRTAKAAAPASPTRETVEVSWSQARRWILGQVAGLPHPVSCRVLEEMFKDENETAETLFGPPIAEIPASLAQNLRTVPHLSAAIGHFDRGSAPGSPEDIEEMTTMAADESARFSEFAEQSNVGPHTLDQFQADLRRIVTVYPNRPIYPLFVELRSLRNRAFALLEGQQPPALTRELYLIAGALCAVLSNASFDLGNIPAAETQSRTAFLCAELAGHNSLRTWIRGTQALIAYWDDRFRDAVNLAEDGWRYAPESGTARVRLASIEARARARQRDPSGTEDALARAMEAREEVHTPDDPGGMMAFPMAKQLYSAAAARLWLGGEANYIEAERLAEESVRLYLSDPVEERRLGEMSLARLDFAVARLARRDLHGAAEQVDEVLEIGGQRRVESVSRRLHQLVASLERPYFQTSALATDLRERIMTSPAQHDRALPGAGVGA